LDPESVGMRPFPRFAWVPLATLITGLGAGLILAPPAGADPAADCETAFAGGRDPRMTLVSDPPAGSDARPGQIIRLSATWGTGGWESVRAVLACVRISDAVNPILSGSEAVPTNDGVFEHSFPAPHGLAAGTVICARMVVAGDPVGDVSDAMWASAKHCFEVHPEEPTPPATSPPATSPPATPTPVTPNQAPPAPAPAISPPTASAPGTPAGADTVTSEGNGSAPGVPVFVTAAPEPPSLQGPVPLPILPETGWGAGSVALARSGMLAVGLGLSVQAAGRRRHRWRHWSWGFTGGRHSPPVTPKSHTRRVTSGSL